MVKEWKEGVDSKDTIEVPRLELGRPAVKLGCGMRTTRRLTVHGLVIGREERRGAKGFWPG